MGADTTPKGFFAPVGGDRPGRPGLAALPPAGRHQPHLLRPLRPTPHGGLRGHVGRLRPGAGQEQPSRGGQPQRPLSQGVRGRRHPGLAGGGRAVAPARDLRHLRRRGRGRAVQRRVRSPPPGRDGQAGAGGRHLDGHPHVSPDRHRAAELLDRFGGGRGRRPPTRSATPSPRPPTTKPGSVPTTSTWPRSTTCRAPSSSIGTRTSACAPRARPSACSTTATPSWAAGYRSTPAAGWPASARPSRRRPWPRCAR